MQHYYISNINDDPPELYVCGCGEEFTSFESIMKHTLDTAPPIDTTSLGRANAAIEFTAHKKTLGKLEKALDLIEGVIAAEIVEFDWEDRAKAFLESVGREVEWGPDNRRPD